MNNYLKVFILNIFMIFVLFGCNASEEYEVYPIEIFLEGIGMFEDCSLDVTKDGYFRVVEGHEPNAREKVKKLSAKQCDEINQLIIEIIENGEKINNSYPIIIEDVLIYAIIEEKKYYSPLSIINEEGANALQKLTHMLIECSPIRLKHTLLL